MIPDSIQPLVSRWQGFADKVKARFQEVLAEADAGYDEVMNIEVVDPAVLSGATSAFQARVRGLQDKVRDAWQKIESELDQVIQDTEDSDECAKMYPVRDIERDRQLQLIDALEMESAALRIHKEAKASRLLKEVADREMQAPRTCHQCSAPLSVPTPHKVTQVVCTHCQAVNSVHPGMATALYYQGGALHNLAHEAALPEWQALVHAEKRFNAWRHPLDPDMATFEQAATAYWTRYLEAMRQLNPDWDAETVQREYTARMGQWRQQLTRHGGEDRAHRNTVITLAATGDAAQVKQWFRQNRLRPDSFVEEMLEAAHEHRLDKELNTLLDAAYTLSGSDDPKPEWIAEKRSELTRYIPVHA